MAESMTKVRRMVGVETCKECSLNDSNDSQGFLAILCESRTEFLAAPRNNPRRLRSG
jgi:hypothetical protein